MKISEIILESKQKEMTLDELSKYKVDDRFSSIVTEHFNDSFSSIKRFLSGEKPLVSVSKDGYTINIMSHGRKILQKVGIKNPAPAGNWMGFWDPDLKPYVSKKDYEKATKEEKMKWDAQVQLDKYIPDQFYEDYARFWMIKDHEKWWFDEGGSRMSGKAENTYWKKKVA